MDILLLDSNPMIQKVLGQGIERSGLRLHRALSIAVARRLINEKNIDLIVLEVELPDGCGFEFAQEIRQAAATKFLPILFLSMRSTPRLQQRVRDLEHAHILPKPVKPKNFVQAVERLLWCGDDEDVAFVSSGSTTQSRDVSTRPTLAIPQSSDRQESASYSRAHPTAAASEGSELNKLARRLSKKLHHGSFELFELMANPEANIKLYAEVVSRHPDLGTAVLKRVNSAAFGLRREVKSAGEACALLGMRDLSATCLKSPVNNSSDGRARRIRQCWQHAIITGFVAQQIASHLCPSSEREVAVAGVGHTLGIVLLLMDNYDRYENVALEAISDGVDWIEAERKRYEFDHATLGHELVTALGQAAAIGQIIREVAEPGSVKTVESWCVAVASAAVQLKRRHFQRRAHPEQDLQQLAREHPAYWKKIGSLIPSMFAQVEANEEVFQS